MQLSNTLNIVILCLAVCFASSTSSTTDSSSNSLSSSSSGDQGSSSNIYRHKNSSFVVVGLQDPIPFSKYPKICYRHKLVPAIVTDCNFHTAIKALKGSKMNHAWTLWIRPGPGVSRNFLEKCTDKKSTKSRACRHEWRTWLKHPISIARNKKGSKMERWMKASGNFAALCMKRKGKKRDLADFSSSESLSSTSSLSSYESGSEIGRTIYGKSKRNRRNTPIHHFPPWSRSGCPSRRRNWSSNSLSLRNQRRGYGRRRWTTTK